MDHKSRESHYCVCTEPVCTGVGNADTESETRSLFLGSTVTGATLGQSESTSSGLGGGCLVEGSNQFLFFPTRA